MCITAPVCVNIHHNRGVGRLSGLTWLNSISLCINPIWIHLSLKFRSSYCVESLDIKFGDFNLSTRRRNSLQAVQSCKNLALDKSELDDKQFQLTRRTTRRLDVFDLIEGANFHLRQAQISNAKVMVGAYCCYPANDTYLLSRTSQLDCKYRILQIFISINIQKLKTKLLVFWDDYSKIITLNLPLNRSHKGL